MASPSIRIHHYSISAPADVLEDVVRFYGDLLDLQPGPRPDFGVPGYWLYAGEEPIVHLIEIADRGPGERGYFDHVALRCTDPQAMKQRIEHLGLEHREMSNDEVRQHQIFVRDPAGTTVELNFLLEA